MAKIAENSRKGPEEEPKTFSAIFAALAILAVKGFLAELRMDLKKAGKTILCPNWDEVLPPPWNGFDR
jgi:hypothetical protein